MTTKKTEITGTEINETDSIFKTTRVDGMDKLAATPTIALFSKLARAASIMRSHMEEIDGLLATAHPLFSNTNNTNTKKAVDLEALEDIETLNMEALLRRKAQEQTSKAVLRKMNKLAKATKDDMQTSLPFLAIIDGKPCKVTVTTTATTTTGVYKLSAKDAVLGRIFTIAKDAKSPEFKSTVYKRVKVVGFLWNSHIIQDIHTRGDILVYVVATDSIAVMKGTEIIEYV